MLFPFSCNGRKYKYDASDNRILSPTCSKSQPTIKSSDFYSYKDGNTTIFIELTKHCNLSCHYCYLSSKNKSLNRENESINKFDAIIHKLDEVLARHKKINLIFYGGEPLLEFELIKQITNYCDSKIIEEGYTIVYGIVTNGTLLDDACTDFLIEKAFSVAISIDGCPQTMLANRGIKDMSKIQHVLSKLNEVKLPASIIATLQNSQSSSIEDDLYYVLKLPVESVRFVPCDSPCVNKSIDSVFAERFCAILTNKVEQMLKEKQFQTIRKLTDLMNFVRRIDSQKKFDRHCGYGKDVFAISADGCLYPCPSFIGKGDFEIKENRVNWPARNGISACSECIAVNTCHGSCQYSNYVALNSAHDSMKARCIINRSMTELALKLYASLYLN